MTENSQRTLRMTYVFGAAALVALMLLIAASFWLVAQTQSAATDVLKARERLTSLSNMLVTTLNAETGQRGYLLTSEPRYLAPFESAGRNVKPRLESLAAVFQDDVSAKSAVDNIRSTVQAKMDELSETVELKKSGKSAEALAIVTSDRGKDLMDQIRSQIGQETDRVNQMLGAGVEKQRGNASLARQFAIGAALAILLAALGAIATILKYTRELLFARSELQTLNTGLEDRVTERTRDLKRANDEIQRFAYIVSHDLRSPLVNVMGYTSELETSLDTLKELGNDPELETLSSGPTAKAVITTDMPESIGFIRKSTSKMDALIKAILKLSREGQRILTPEQINLEEFFASILTNVQHRMSELGGQITIATRLPVLHSDRLALEQIFVNLVDNAIKYRASDRPPEITIRQASGAWGSVVIDVDDNGRGIAAVDHERVFDLFRRAGPQDQQGEGIGLAHVRALVRRLGGEITMTSELGHGTTFRVTLPKTLQTVAEQSSG